MVLALEKLGASGGDWEPAITGQINKMIANSLTNDVPGMAL